MKKKDVAILIALYTLWFFVMFSTICFLIQ